jgi:hypothetical protein
MHGNATRYVDMSHGVLVVGALTEVMGLSPEF